MMRILRVVVRVALVALVGAVAMASTASSAAAQGSEEPREVRVGILLVDLTQVRDAEQTFAADVFVAATWHDPELAGGEGVRTRGLDEVWHPTLLLYNRVTASESLPDEVVVRPDGSVTWVQRYTGLFSAPMDLREFPKDRQEFYVWLVSPVRVGPAVTLLADTSLAALRNAQLSISDWDVGEPELAETSFQMAPGAPANPGVKLTIPANRRFIYYSIQVLIPLVAVVLMAYAVFWIAPSVVPTRVGVVVTTMLTLIAYRFMLANHVPRLSYLTRLDWFMLGATLLVILALFTMAATSYLMSREQERIVKRIDRAGRVLYPLAFAVYSLVVWLG